MALRRATIRDKLNLLLLVPIVATVLLAVPFVAAQVDQARNSSRIAAAAYHARHVSQMLYALQRERIAVLELRAGGGAGRLELMRLQALTDHATDLFHTDMAGHTTPRLDYAHAQLHSLDWIRARAFDDTTAPDAVYQDYVRLTRALLAALGPDGTISGPGTGSLELLDALLRANEHSSQISAALMVAATDPKQGNDLLAAADALRQFHTLRFLRIADESQGRLMRAIAEGRSTQSLNQLATQARTVEGRLGVGFVARASAVAEAQATMREQMVARTVRQVENAAAQDADAAVATAWLVSTSALLVVAVMIGLGVAVGRSISQPVRQLTDAARRVAGLAGAELERVADSEQVDDQPPRLAAIAVDSKDEVGDLAAAFNQVQTTAALLLERQVQSRRNVSLMFSSVARRTQNLVGGQLALIDQLERNEQDPRLLAELYRLDHLSMRLRRSAESLLVVSGVRDDTRLATPASLTTVLRSALAEIEDFRRVRLVSLYDVTVAPDAVADLSLLFAELLENATAYSPPASMVDVSAEWSHGGCRVSIVDRGIGMSAVQLAQENQRFVQRERLDIAPTTVLGLFVVGRLARRHGVSVVLRPTPGGGVTAVLDLPSRLLTAPPETMPGWPEAAQPQPGPSTAPADTGPQWVPAGRAAAGLATRPSGGFAWFSRGGSPGQGQALPRTAPAGQPEPPQQSAPLRPAPLAGEPPGGPPTRGGLTRRVPGAHLAPTARPQSRGSAGPVSRPAAPQVRDPEQERANLDAFVTAVARAEAATAGQHVVPGPHVARGREPGSGVSAEEEST